jgi:ATP-dependent protease ClpP protease subunit
MKGILLLAFLVSIMGSEVVEGKAKTQLIGEVSPESVSAVLDVLKEHPDEPVSITINSGGGSVMPGLELARAIEKHGNVTCTVNGMAASMAFVILQACQWRITTPDSILMQHPPSLSLDGNMDKTPLKEYVDLLEALEEGLYYRSCKKITLPESVCRAKIEKVWWMSPKEALSVNAVDEVKEN